MPIAYKPAGYTDTAVYLHNPQAQRVIDFAVAAFGAQPLRRYTQPDGSLMHAELRVGDTVVMLADAQPGQGYTAWLHVYLPDVDEAYQRALAAGGLSVQAPVQHPGDPDRRGGVSDPAGNTWWLATQVSPG
ncbi:MAG TPA: VOC family protein [Chloroflexia bacterium]|nr:VOC family protein [Chloroflexia bacterium]